MTDPGISASQVGETTGNSQADSTTESDLYTIPPGVSLLNGHTPKYVYDLLATADWQHSDEVAEEVEYYFGFPGIDSRAVTTGQQLELQEEQERKAVEEAQKQRKNRQQLDRKLKLDRLQPIRSGLGLPTVPPPTTSPPQSRRQTPDVR